MTVEEVKKIIDEESLKGGNLFEKRENKENEMVIMNVAEQWLVYATDERASKITGSEKKFKTEEEALDNFITRLRALNVLKNWGNTFNGSVIYGSKITLYTRNVLLTLPT